MDKYFRFVCILSNVDYTTPGHAKPGPVIEPPMMVLGAVNVTAAPIWHNSAVRSFVSH